MSKQVVFKQTINDEWEVDGDLVDFTQTYKRTIRLERKGNLMLAASHGDPYGNSWYETYAIAIYYPESGWVMCDEYSIPYNDSIPLHAWEPIKTFKDWFEFYFKGADYDEVWTRIKRIIKDK
jgi:hypothetical protein